jgi:uncharacterized protein YcgI (DUF1989 family)
MSSSDYNADIDPVKAYERAVSPDRDFYDRVIATKESGARALDYESVLEKHTGDAYLVEAGQVIRFEQRPTLHNGRTQILDILFFTPDLEQWSDHLSTTAVGGFNPRLYGSLWTQSGYLKKIVTIVADEYPYDELPDKVNHMFFAAHCSSEYIQLAYGKDAALHNSCHMNFLQGVNRIPAVADIEDEAERRKTVQWLADRNDLNVFQPNQIIPDETGNTRGKMYLSPSVPDGTGLEFYAEQDCYAVVSNCPYADQNLPLPDADPNPVYVSVWDTGIPPAPDRDPDLVPGDEWEPAIYEMFGDGTKDVSPRRGADSY